MDKMRALVRSAGRVTLCDVPRPRPERPGEVLVRVAMAGICRTDLWAADGRITTADPVVLGHELAGTVHALASDVSRLRIGDRVVVEPFVAVGGAYGGACPSRRMLGIDRDGAFADLLLVPEGGVHLLPREVTFRAGAYIEPVAAALAVMRAPLGSGRGLVVGSGRIAVLTGRVLAAAGFSNVDVVSLRDAEAVDEGSYAFAVETVASTDALGACLRAIHRGGTVVLKSRDRAPVGLSIGDVVAKEATLKGVEHAPFADAIALVAKDGSLLADLAGEMFALADHALAFSRARASEATKVFFRIDPEALL